MSIIQNTALALILGTVLIYTGFSIFPPRIFMEKNAQKKMDLLAKLPRLWIISQLFVILGALVTAAGSIFLSLFFGGSQEALLVRICGVGFVLGHVFWIWYLGLRTAQPQKFAKNELPGWLFGPYSVLTLLGLAGFGVAFWLQGEHPVLGAGIFLGALLTLGLFLKFRDMPPFIYYGMTLIIGITLLF